MALRSRDRAKSPNRRQENIRLASTVPASAQAATDALPSSTRPHRPQSDVRVGVAPAVRGAATPRPFGVAGNPAMSEGARITVGGRPLDGHQRVPTTQTAYVPHGDGAAVTVRKGPLQNMQPDVHGAVPVTGTRNPVFQSSMRSSTAATAQGPVTPAATRPQAQTAGAAVRPSGTPNGPRAVAPVPDDGKTYLKPPTKAGDGSYAVSVSGKPKLRTPQAEAGAGEAADSVA